MSPSDTASSTPTTAHPPSINAVLLHGHVSTKPTVRELPSGQIVADFSVSTTPGGGGRVSTPVAWHKPGRLIARLDRDVDVIVVGYVARRFYRAGGRLSSRTEVIAERVALASHRKTAAKHVGRIAADLTTHGEDVFG